MSIGLEVAGSTIRRMLDHTRTVYLLNRSYIHTVSEVRHSYQIGDGRITPRFFRVELPSPDSIVTIAPYSTDGYGSSLAVGSKVITFAKTWRDSVCEVYMVNRPCQLLIGVYTPAGSAARIASGYGIKISSATDASFISSNDELLFPYAVGQPDLIKGVTYPQKVSISISRVGSVASVLAGHYPANNQEGDAGDGSTNNQARPAWFTSAYFVNANTPVGGALCLNSNRFVKGGWKGCGVGILTKDYDGTDQWPDWTYQRNFGLNHGVKLPTGAIMVARAPNLATVV